MCIVVRSRRMLLKLGSSRERRNSIIRNQLLRSVWTRIISLITLWSRIMNQRERILIKGKIIKVGIYF
jgi:hypothetical protein